MKSNDTELVISLLEDCPADNLGLHEIEQKK